MESYASNPNENPAGTVQMARYRSLRFVGGTLQANTEERRRSKVRCHRFEPRVLENTAD